MGMIRISISTLLIAIVCLFVIMLFLTIYLIAKRRAEVQCRQAINDYIAELGALWHSFLTGEAPMSDRLIPHSAHEREAVEEILLSYTKNLSNSLIRERITQFAGQYLTGYYEKQLRSYRWSMRLNALYRITEFNLMSEMADSLEKFERRRRLTAEEEFQLLKIELATASGDRFLRRLLSAKAVFSEHEYRQLFLNADPEVLEHAMEQFEDLLEVSKWALIDAVGFKREIIALSFLESLLNDKDAELRIKALKAIYRIGVVLELDKYLAFITSTMWEERLMVAKIMENVPLEDSILHLHRLAEDESWWVRKQANITMGETMDEQIDKEYEKGGSSHAAETSMGEATF